MVRTERFNKAKKFRGPVNIMHACMTSWAVVAPIPRRGFPAGP